MKNSLRERFNSKHVNDKLFKTLYMKFNDSHQQSLYQFSLKKKLVNRNLKNKKIITSQVIDIK